MTSGDEGPLRRSLLKWRLAAIGLLVLLVLLLGASFYTVVDQGISLAYRDDELRRVQHAQALLEKIALRVSSSTTKPELLQLLREAEGEPFEKPEEGGVHAEGLSFYFTAEGSLACVTSDYPPEDTRCAQFAKPMP